VSGAPHPGPDNGPNACRGGPRVSAKLHEITLAGKQQTLFAGAHAIGACDGGPQLNLDVLPVLRIVTHCS